MGSKQSQTIADLSKVSPEFVSKAWKQFEQKYPKGTLTKAQFVEDNVSLKGGDASFWEAIFELVDENGNGYIDFKEYLMLLTLSSVEYSSKEALEQVFNLLDLNKDGVLDKEEMLLISKVLYTKMRFQNQLESIFAKNKVDDKTEEDDDEDEVQKFSTRLFDLMDENHDGKIQKSEFLNVCLKNCEIQHMLMTSLEQYQILFDRSKLNKLSEVNVQPSHQVGGHRDVLYEHEVIYKPLVKNEFEFYEKVFVTEPNDPIHAGLRNIVADYRGKKVFSESSMHHHYIVLRNLVDGLKEPCVLDCKLGQHGYAKKHSKKVVKKVYQSAIEKFSSAKKYGFRLSGMKSFKKSTNSYFKMSKQRGLMVKPSKIPDVFINFVNNGEEIRASLYEKAIPKLKKILKWFEMQRKYVFFSSSVLFIYDGEKKKDEEEKMIIKLVDFAHVFDSKGKKDENVIYGLRALIQLLELLKVFGAMKTSFQEDLEDV